MKNAIKIVARGRNGIRRCGVFHPGDKAVEHPAGTFTAEQLEILRADPDLHVDERADSALSAPSVSLVEHQDVLANLAAVRESAATQAAENDQLRSRVSSLTSELSTRSSQLASAQAQLTSTQSQLTAAQGRIKELEAAAKEPAEKTSSKKP